MRKLFLLLLVLVALPTPAADTVVQASATTMVQTNKPASQDTVLGVQAGACTIPAAAGCSTIFSARDVSAFSRASLWICNTAGSNVVTDIIVEGSPTGAVNTWVVFATISALATTAGLNCVKVNIAQENVPWLRVEARSAAGTNVSTWITVGRP